MFFRIVVLHGTLVTTILMKNDYSRLYRIIAVFDYSISANPGHPTLRPPPEHGGDFCHEISRRLGYELGGSGRQYL